MSSQLLRNVLSTIVLIVLVASSAGAAAATHASVRPTIAGYGVVTIYANGTISNGAAPITQSGSTYTLTGTLAGSLVVLASGITVNGAGYTVNYTRGMLGGDNASITVSGVSNDLFENLRVANATYGVHVNNSHYVSIIDSVLSNGSRGAIGPVGVFVGNSTNIDIAANDVNDSSYASLFLEFDQNVRVAANLLENTSGVPLTTDYALYADYVDNLAVDGNGGQGTAYGFLAEYGVGVSFQNNNASFIQKDGIGVEYSSNVAIDNNDAFQTAYGAWSEYSTNVSVENNSLPYNFNPIYDYGDTNFRAVDNFAPFARDTPYITSGTPEGIYSDYSSNSLFLNNDLGGSAFYGAYLYYEGSAVVQGNNLSDAHDYGAYIYYNYGRINLSGNDLSANTTIGSADGVYVYESYGPVVLWANNLSNQGYGVFAEYTEGSLTIAGNTFAGPYTGVSADYLYGALNVLGNRFVRMGTAVVDDYQYGGSFTAMYNWLPGVTAGGIGVSDYYFGTVAVTIAHNVAANSTVYGVISLYATMGTTVVSNNDLANTTVGVYINYAWGGSVTVSGNDLNNSSSAGVYLYDTGYHTGTTPYASTPIVVSGNYIDSSNDGIEVEYAIGDVTISGNVATNTTYGIYVYYPYGNVAITGNTLTGDDYGIYEYEAQGGSGVTVSGNSADHTVDAGIYLSYDYAPDVITGNSVRFSGFYAIDVYSPEIGGATIANNNATGSDIALALLYSSYGTSTIMGNDLSHSTYVNVSYDTGGTAFIANDLLGDTYTNFTFDQVVAFYHNDLPSAAFAQSNNLPAAVWNAAYPIGGNYWTGYAGTDTHSGPSQNVPGADGIGDTPYTISSATDAYPLMGAWVNAAVVFAESGLPSGTTWSVTLNGITESALAGATMSFAQANGATTSYQYSVSSSGAQYRASVAHGTVTENGANQHLTVVFTPVAYGVTFTWTEPVPPVNWSVTLGGITHTSSTGTILFNVTNGTYAYTVAGTYGYTPTPSSGSVDVTGANKTVSVTMNAPTVTITFVLTGATAGATWSVALNGGAAVQSSSATISLHVAAGSYTFTVSAPSGDSVSPSKGTVLAGAGGATVYVAATPSSSASTIGGTGATGAAYYGLLAVLVIAILAALVGWVLYFRKPKGGTSGPMPPYAGSTSMASPPGASPPNSPPPGATGSMPPTSGPATAPPPGGPPSP